MASLPEDVAGLKEHVERLTTRLEKMEGRVGSLLQDKAKLREDFESLSLEISAHRADLNEFMTRAGTAVEAIEQIAEGG